MKCKVPSCSKEKRYLNGYCQKHYDQVKRHGKVLKRTIYTPNKFEIIKDICIIYHYDKNCKLKGKSYVDKKFYIKVMKYKWCIDSLGYVNNSKVGRMHKFLFSSPIGEEIDHKNRNKLDNRLLNLRIVSRGQNTINRGNISSNTSGFKGVSWNKRERKWKVYTTKNNKQISLGCFDDYMEAVNHYKKEIVKIHGKYAKFNLKIRRIKCD